MQKTSYPSRDEVSQSDFILNYISQPRFSRTLQQIVRHCAEITECPMAFMYAFIDGDFMLITSYGLSPVKAANWQTPHRSAAGRAQTTYEYGDLLNDPISREMPMVSGPPHFRYSIGTPIPFRQWGSPQDFLALWCPDFVPRKESGDRVKSLIRVADIASNMLELIYDIYLTEAREPDPAEQHQLRDVSAGQHYGLPPHDEATRNADILAIDRDVVTRFLDETLLSRQKMQQRDQRVYFSARAWRQAIKSYQIQAVRQLKRNPPDQFVDMVSADLEQLIIKMLGRVSAACVVPVPCGHSGPGCLSCRVAQRLAERLGLPCHLAFADLPQKGSSHPKTNARRPAMRLQMPVSGTVILVDDIATSGSHIAEAARILDREAESVVPLVWISD